MARSQLGAFVSGTRQMLTAQLIISVAAVALAGWTLGVTNELIRERDRLRERVIQLEETMAARGEMPPEAPAVVQRPPAQVYPGSIDAATAPPESSAGGDDAAQADRPDLSRIIGDLFVAPPPLHTVVLHVRGQSDQAYAQRLAEALMESEKVRAVVAVMPPGDGRASGYAYYDGRQSRAAAGMVQRFSDLARDHQIAPWSAQLRGTALPAQGEYSVTRLDIVLPPLPSLQLQRLDPQLAAPSLQQPQQSQPIP